MDRESAWLVVNRLSKMRGNDTIPTEDVIDLAQALQYVLEKVDGPNPEDEPGCDFCRNKEPMYQERGMTCPHCGTHGWKPVYVGPRCPKCKQPTTKTREKRGACMKCEHEAKAKL